jgi:hypothetical protein
MDLLLALSHVLAFLMLALAIALPPLRRSAVIVLLVVAGIGLIAGAAEGGTRSLTTVHHYAGYEGAAMEVSMVAFPTGTFEAPAWQWPLPFAGFAAIWIGVLLWLQQRPVQSAWVLPTLLAWTGLATWLDLQHLAAPAAVVQPIGLDRFLWPAGLALALLAARRASGLLVLFVTVGGGVMLARLPAALFSKYASDNGLGTCLDIGSVRDIVNPMTQMQFEPRLVAGSSEQQFWLIWLEHVIFYPAVYVMSLFGIALAAHMFHRHGPETEA